MAITETITLLQTVPMFAGLSEEALENVATRVSDFEARAGQVLIQPQQPGSGLLILTSGQATVEIGSRTIECGPGECIGELSLLVEEVVHVARVRATSDVRGLALGRDDFAELVASDHQIALGLLKTLASRLIATDRMLSATP